MRIYRVTGPGTDIYFADDSDAYRFRAGASPAERVSLTVQVIYVNPPVLRRATGTCARCGDNTTGLFLCDDCLPDPDVIPF